LERQQTGLTDQATSTRIGEQFNVNRIVTGRVASVKSLGIIQVNVEMIEMRTAQIVVSKTLTYDGEMKGFILEKVPEIVALLAGEEPVAPVAAKAPPAPPPGLRATEGGPGQITLLWGNVPDTDRYNIYYSTLPGVNRATATKIAGVNSPFRHAGLSEETTYFYIVTAENEAGESADSNEASAITMAGAAPPPEPVVAAEPSTWPKTLGVVLLVAGGVFQLAAFSTATAAEDDAATALENNDAELYQQALDDRDSAEGLQGAALLMGLAGVLFVVLSGNGSDASAGLGPDGGTPPSFEFAATPDSVMAGYTLRW
jgi:hypothetical protein